MIKKIIKIILGILLVLIFVISYLSIYGIKTNKFNSIINDNILKINKKINLNLNDVKYLLNPYNFSVNIKTENSQILLANKNLQIKDIQTNISLNSLINGQISIDDLQLITKDIKLNDIISLVRTFQNSPQLFVLDTIIKDGFINANINLNFDENGKIKNDYKIKGTVKKTKLDFLNKYRY